MNALLGKLGLLDDDRKRKAKLLRLCADLGDKMLTPLGVELSWRYSEADLDAGTALAADWRQWSVFTARTEWSKKQGHTWFARPASFRSCPRLSSFSPCSASSLVPSWRAQ